MVSATAGAAALSRPGLHGCLEGLCSLPPLLLRDPTPAATLSRQPERPAMAASTASHRPIKGILKNKTSVASPPVVPSAEQPRPIVEEELR